MDHAGEAAMRPPLRSEVLSSGDAGWPESAFEAAFIAHYPRIVTVIYRIVGNHSRAEELASDTFLKLYEQPFSPERFHNVAGWLYRTATRLGFDSLRSLARRKRHESDAGGLFGHGTAPADPLEAVLHAERQRNIRKALVKLKPIEAQVLALRASGFSYREVAEAVGVKEQSIGRLLARAEEAFENAYRREERRTCFHPPSLR